MAPRKSFAPALSVVIALVCAGAVSFAGYGPAQGSGGGGSSVTLPGSSTDNGLARWDGTGGDTLQDSDSTLSDDGELVLSGSFNVELAPGAGGRLVVKDPSGVGSGQVYVEADSSFAKAILNSQTNGRLELLEGSSGVQRVTVDAAGSTGGLHLSSTSLVTWSNSGNSEGTLDLGLERQAAGVLQVTDGSTGGGGLNVGTVTYSTATGDFSAGNNADQRIFWDASAQTFALYNSDATGTAKFEFDLSNEDLNLASDSAIRWGSTADALQTMDVELARDGAAGALKLYDPAGGSDGALRVYDAANAEYVQVTHDGADGVIQTSASGSHLRVKNSVGTTLAIFNASTGSLTPGGAFGLGTTTDPWNGVRVGDANDGGAQILVASELLDVSTTTTTTNLVPAGATLLQVSTRVVTVIVGSATFDVGDGSDADRFGAGILVAAGTTSGHADYTADPRSWSSSAQDVTLTPGTSFTSGEVRVTATYMIATAPGS